VTTDYNICMAVKIKVMKPGYDVLEKTDERNIILDSDLNHLKTKISSNYQQAIADNGDHTTTIAHGLGYRPLAMCYFRNTANDKWFISSTNPEDSEFRQSISANVNIYVDTTNVYLKIFNNTGGAATFEVKYEIFYEGDE